MSETSLGAIPENLSITDVYTTATAGAVTVLETAKTAKKKKP